MERARILIVVLLGVLAAAAPAPAASPGTISGADQALSVVRERMAPLRHRVDRVRAAGELGTVSGAVRAAAVAAGHEASVTVERDPGPSMTFRAAVARIAGAVRLAEATLHDPGMSLAEAQRLVDRAVTDPVGNASLRGPDPTAALRAAAQIAAAVDVALPALRRAGSPGGDDAPCDLLDRSPALCVSGDGAHTYEQDVNVLIDVGGADVYRNAAGGAVTGAMLALDLAGNDTYEASNRHAHGVGAVGGVGMLLDLAGDDAYRVRTSQTTALLAQGASSVGGFGLLLDAAGKDLYEAVAEVEGATAGMQAQGFGALGGIGALIDGRGDDSYLVRATSLPRAAVIDHPVVEYAGPAAAGQGDGVIGGAGLLLDSGGTDRLEVAATMAPSAPGGPHAHGPADDFVAHAGGQGSSLIGGQGLLVTGPGDTTYLQTASVGPFPAAQPVPSAQAFGQGAASIGAVAALSDGGGNDVYAVTAAVSSAVSFTATDGCACEEPVSSVAGLAQIQGLGQGLDGSLGLVEDVGGNDAYTSTTTSEAALAVTDERSEPAQALISGDVTAGRIIQVAQAAGLGPGGTGALWDEVGNDAYTAVASSTATAEGSADLAVNEPTLSPAGGNVLLDAQGAGRGADLGNLVVGPGVGALVDLAGGDRYRTTVSSRGLQDGEDVAPGTVAQHVQASSDALGTAALGLLVDVDLVAPPIDRFEQTPPLPACLGTRGGQSWRDCDPLGIGINT